MIRTGTGNLLQADVDALVNTVNCVGVMGKGIALQFKKAWPAMFRDYQVAAKAEQIVPGRIHVWPMGTLTAPHYILNFPTKRHWRNRSRLEDIEVGLVDLVARIRGLGIQSIAVPPLGAGNGGLPWDQVRPLIVRALGDLEGVDVVLWEPGQAPRPAEQPVGTPRPAWTPARAAMVALMGAYQVLDDELTQLEAQKLAYLLQEAGHAGLGLRFQKHHYGPYADQLYHLLLGLEGHFLRGLEDRRPEARLRLDHQAVAEARAYLANTDDDVEEHFRKVTDLIEGFETPYGMELLTTVHFLAKQHAAVADDPEAAVGAVQAWSSRKRSTMKPVHVHKVWRRLHEQGWLSPVPASSRAVG